MKVLVQALLLLVFCYISYSCKSVSFCSDSFANNCTPLYDERAGTVLEEDEEVVMSYNTIDDTTVLAQPTITLTEQQKALLALKKKTQNKYVAGNIVLSDGRFVCNAFSPLLLLTIIHFYKNTKMCHKLRMVWWANRNGKRKWRSTNLRWLRKEIHCLHATRALSLLRFPSYH